MFQPEKYSQHLDQFIDITKQLYQKHQKPLLVWSSEPESILDLGIGDGRTSKEVTLSIIPKNVKEYVGADISEVMLKVAEKTVQHEKLSVVQMDAATKNLPDNMNNRFHHIFACYLFHHVQDLRYGS